MTVYLRHVSRAHVVRDLDALLMSIYPTTTYPLARNRALQPYPDHDLRIKNAGTTVSSSHACLTRTRGGGQSSKPTQSTEFREHLMVPKRFPEHGIDKEEFSTSLSRLRHARWKYTRESHATHSTLKDDVEPRCPYRTTYVPSARGIDSEYTDRTWNWCYDATRLHPHRRQVRLVNRLQRERSTQAP
ncbi:hypothetical protein CC80DRAFT_197304 [Byssothecium circinans]|uniref:Uncharacterized protein n=1 Tax=Byssothecium circinans TaxID=147558 RepID=A0A6A5UAJ7_9PLEO|nr:hypothetical protein CC80DRAFT_197304 [Byssothecium circinans]